MIKTKSLIALSILYDRYAAVIYGTIYRDVNDLELAENILQQSFINLWNNPDIESKYKNRLLLWMVIIAKRLTFKASRYIPTKDNSNNKNFSR